MTWLSRLLPRISTLQPRPAAHDRSTKRRRRATTLESLEHRVVLSNVSATFSAGVLSIVSNVASNPPIGGNAFDIIETSTAAGGKVTVSPHAGSVSTTVNGSSIPWVTPGAVTSINVKIVGANKSIAESVYLSGPGKTTPTPVKTVNFTVTAANLTLGANGVDDSGAFTLNTTGGLNASIDDSTFSALTINQTGSCCVASVELGDDSIGGAVRVTEGMADGDSITLQDGDKFGSTTLAQGNGDDDSIYVVNSTVKDLAVTQGDGGGDVIYVDTVAVSLSSFGVTTRQGAGSGDTTAIITLTGVSPINDPTTVPSIIVVQGDVAGEYGDYAVVYNSTVPGNISITQGDGDEDGAEIYSSNAGIASALGTFYGNVSITQGDGSYATLFIIYVNANDIELTQGDGAIDQMFIYGAVAAGGGILASQGSGTDDYASITSATAAYNVFLTQGDGDYDAAFISDAVSNYGVIGVAQGGGRNDSASISFTDAYSNWTAIFQGDGDFDFASIESAYAYGDVSIHGGGGDGDYASIADSSSSNNWVAIWQLDGAADGARISDATSANDVSIYQGSGADDYSSISYSTALSYSHILQGGGDGDYAEMIQVTLGTTQPFGPYVLDNSGDAVIDQGDGYNDIAVVGGGSVVNNVRITQGDNLFTPGCEPGLGDEVHINDTVVTSDIVIVQGTSEAVQGGYLVTIGDTGDVTAGGATYIYQNGGGNADILGGDGSSFTTNYLDIWTGAAGDAFVSAENTTVLVGSQFGLDFTVNGGPGPDAAPSNTFVDLGGNYGVTTSDAFNNV